MKTLRANLAPAAIAATAIPAMAQNDTELVKKTQNPRGGAKYRA